MFEAIGSTFTAPVRKATYGVVASLLAFAVAAGVISEELVPLKVIGRMFLFRELG